MFELFIFSDVFELNRDKLIEGQSVMITLIKNYSDETKTQKRINVKKIISLKEIINKPIKKITFKFNDIHDLKKLKKLDKNNGETEVKVVVDKSNEIHFFSLKSKRKINNQLLNTLNLAENVLIE